MRIVFILLIFSILFLFNNCTTNTEFNSLNSIDTTNPDTATNESPADPELKQPGSDPSLLSTNPLTEYSLVLPHHYVQVVDVSSLSAAPFAQTTLTEANLPIYFKDIDATGNDLEITASWRLISQFMYDQSYNQIERFNDLSLSWSNFLLKDTATFIIKPNKVNESCDTSALCSWKLRITNLLFGDHGFVRYEVNVKVKDSSLNRKFLIDFVIGRADDKQKKIVIANDSSGRPARNTIVANSCDLRSEINDDVKSFKIEWSYRRASTNTHFQFFAPLNLAQSLQDQERIELWDANVFRGPYYRTKLFLKCVQGKTVVDGFEDYDQIPELASNINLDKEFSAIKRSLCGTNNCR